MTINVPNPVVLRAGFANIQANLDFWDQEHWVLQDSCRDRLPAGNKCGTTACLAGHILLSQGYSWDTLKGMSVMNEAMFLLGYQQVQVTDLCEDCGVPHEVTVWSGDGDEFEKIFYKIYSSKGGILEYDQAKLDEFKAYVTELTGIEL